MSKRPSVLPFAKSSAFRLAISRRVLSKTSSMNIKILTTKDFDRDFRRLEKRYRSLPDDLRGFYDKSDRENISDSEISARMVW